MTVKRYDIPWTIVIVAAVGYFVDLFDTFLVPAFRVPALRDLGVANIDSLRVYTDLFNLQLAGMFLGALFLWGPFADGRGRRKILFGSIMLYGVANLLTAFAGTVPQFAIIRLVAGVGLGGQLGAGVTLVAENTSVENRGIGTAIIGFVGMLGVVAAGILAKAQVNWRSAYIVGGLLAFLVLAVRLLGVNESRLFEKNVAGAKRSNYSSILVFLLRPRNLLKVVCCILVGAPTFFVTGLLVPGAPEFGAAFGMKILPTPATGLIWTYLSISVGDIFCGLLSQALRSRKKALLVFHAVTVIGIAAFLFQPPVTPNGFYLRCVIAGLGIGFWANMVTNAAEQFGTNVRATVTITVPTCVRLLLFPISAAFLALRPSLGLVPAAAVVGFSASAIAIAALLWLEDGFSRNMDFNERLTEVRPTVSVGSATRARL
jgi:MFS family permease